MLFKVYRELRYMEIMELLYKIVYNISVMIKRKKWGCINNKIIEKK